MYQLHPCGYACWFVIDTDVFHHHTAWRTPVGKERLLTRLDLRWQTGLSYIFVWNCHMSTWLEEPETSKYFLIVSLLSSRPRIIFDPPPNFSMKVGLCRNSMGFFLTQALKLPGTGQYGRHDIVIESFSKRLDSPNKKKVGHGLAKTKEVYSMFIRSKENITKHKSHNINININQPDRTYVKKNRSSWTKKTSSQVSPTQWTLFPSSYQAQASNMVKKVRVKVP